MKGAVEMLGLRPEQLTSNDFGEQQVGGWGAVSNPRGCTESESDPLDLSPDW